MFRMSQKLLITLLFLLSPGFLSSMELKLIGSIETGPEGIHLNNPTSIYISNDSKIYVTDTGNHRFISYSHNLKPLKQFNAAGMVKIPAGMVKDSNGNIWYIERATNSIVFINLKDKKIIKKSLNLFPGRISIYKNKLVVLDRLSGKIIIINRKFHIVKKIFPEISDFKGFFDLKVKGNRICGMENLTGRIFCFNMINGKQNSIILSKKMTQPVSFDIDDNGNIFILDRYLKKVLIFNSNGRFLSSILKEGERPGELYYPWQILIKNKRIYIVDEGNGRVDVFKF